jgi:anti-sigma regulatory factor (Ser/Thr protein kinase)
MIAPIDPPGDALMVEAGSLSLLREAVARFARRCGLSGTAVRDFVLVANELATNVIIHGGGIGRMWLWCRGGAVYCQVSDQGGGMTRPESAGTTAREPAATGGRGLWLIRQLCQRLYIATDATGTTVTVAMAR